MVTMSNEPAEHPTHRMRDGTGRYAPDQATAHRAAQASRLFSQGLTYQQIANEIGCAVSTAHSLVRKARELIVREPAEEAIKHSLTNLEEERARLSDRRVAIIERRRRIEEMHTRPHVTVQHGKVVYDEGTGMPVPDDEFQLKIDDRLQRIDEQLMRVDEQLRRNDESRRRLEGLDQPVKTEVTGGVRYEVVGIDPDDLK
jgi:DNA-binding CsgD family transcriptional regulator